ncbi:hypothetical protein BBO_08087 [Beauveria brongniartii RCEF 3172]|uniref:Uncharacterized protein n=1 Tax=Beauveria brongniartii RCEF 3172 TaxID=1081107 RepID=A0A166S6F9_9HYPO|nr:hypothetical protein BBO_08087 [Beauveria brongniartii RCEF 3172]
MKLSSVPGIVAAALALASIGHTEPIRRPPKRPGVESANVNQLNQGSGLSHVTAPKANQARAERKGDEVEVVQARAERKDNEPEWSENLWATGRRAVEVNHLRAERKDDEPEVNQARAERKGDEVEVVQARAERKDNEPEGNWPGIW